MTIAFTIPAWVLWWIGVPVGLVVVVVILMLAALGWEFLSAFSKY